METVDPVAVRLHFGWIVRKELACASLPGRFGPLRDDLQWLYERGVRTIISATELPLKEGKVEEVGFDYHHLPVPDMHAPTFAQMQDFSDLVEGSLSEGRPVLVHCLGGIGRSSTLACAYFIAKKGMSVTEAMAFVAENRYGPGKPGYAVQTKAQAKSLHRFSALLQQRAGT